MHPKSYSIASGPSSATKSKASGGVWKKVKQLDWLAPEVGLNYRGHSGIQTYFGVIMTLLSSAVFISGFVFIVANYFDLSQPVVLQDVFNQLAYHDINLPTSLRFSAVILLFNNTPMPASRISTFVTMESMVRKQELVESPSGVQFKSLILKKPLIPCKDLSPDVLKLMPKGAETEWAYLSQFGMCPDFNLEDYKVFGKVSDRQVSFLEVTIFPCSLDAGKCATKEMLEKVTLSHVRIEPNQNMSDYNNPIGYEWSTNDFFFLNIANKQISNLQLMKTEVWNDRGLFSYVHRSAFAFKEDTVRVITAHRDPTQLSCPASPTEDNCGFYVKLRTLSGGKVLKLTRIYKGAIETIGEIGGIRDIVFTAAIAIYWFFHSKLTSRQVADQIFDIPEGSTKRKDLCSSVVMLGQQTDLKDELQLQQALPQTLSPNIQQSELEGEQSSSSVVKLVPATKQEGTVKTPEAVATCPKTHFEFDYKTAEEIIEDSLDVVNIVRRIHWLEAFAKFVLHGQHIASVGLEEQALLTNHAMYLLCRDKIDQTKTTSSAKSKSRLPPEHILGESHRTHGNMESGRISSELCHEFLCFLTSRTQQEAIDKVKLESARDNLGKEEAASPLASVTPVGFLQKVQKEDTPQDGQFVDAKSPQEEIPKVLTKSQILPKPAFKPRSSKLRTVAK